MFLPPKPLPPNALLHYIISTQNFSPLYPYIPLSLPFSFLFFADEGSPQLVQFSLNFGRLFYLFSFEKNKIKKGVFSLSYLLLS